MKIEVRFDKIQIRGLNMERFRRLCGEEIENTIATNVDKFTQGKNPDGGAFPDYSPAYKQKRIKSGRSASPVNLTWSGDLRDSYQRKDTPSGSEGMFLGTHGGGFGGSNAMLAAIVAKTRQFFGFGSADIARITRRIERESREAVGKIIVIQKGT